MTRLNTRGKIGKTHFLKVFICTFHICLVFSGRWHRKGLRRRPPTPPTSATSEISGPSDLKQRILEILTTTNNNQNCDPELIRLRRELESNANEAMASRRPHHSRRKRPHESEMTEEEAERRRRRRAARRAERLRMASTLASPTASVTSNPISNILGSTNPGTHIATDHEDTSEGAVHCFQDEFGNWHSYTFGQESSGTASMVVPNVTTHFRQQPPLATSGTSRRASRSSSCVSTSSGLTVILDNPTMVFQVHYKMSDQTEQLKGELKK